jgi:outer membrane protein TolC
MTTRRLPELRTSLRAATRLALPVALSMATLAARAEEPAVPELQPAPAATAPQAGPFDAQPTAPAQQPAPEAQPAAPAAAPAEVFQTLDLAGCINLALQRQPRIAAARASLAAAHDAQRALDDLRIPTIIDREIPVRRQQACLGVTAAAAAVEQAEHETVYAVTRTYYTVVFAREQERVARGVVDSLGAVRDVVRQRVEGAARDVTNNDVDRTTSYMRQAQTQQIQAAEGVKRALAALREAIGVGPECHIEVAAGQLPQLDVRLGREDVIAKALARRPELVQAGIFEQETCLEIDAQGTSHHLRKETFAAGGDIHAKQVPQGEHNDAYRPGGILPEMPTLLVGNKADRVQRARSLNARAGAMVATTRNLIALEAEDAFLRWEQASLQLPAAKEAAETGERLAENLATDYRSQVGKGTVEGTLNARVLGARARSAYNEVLYHQILALADIERITAGGVCAGLVELAAVKTQPAAAEGGAAK